MQKHVLFIHGWSVTGTEAYGELPARLAGDFGLEVRHLHLGKYISFHDEVRLSDLATALEAAIGRELRLPPGERFAVIAHSTGGPVLREWFQRFYLEQGRPCPVSHAIHLAGAHFGSALAQLGKGGLSRGLSWLKRVEPGSGVLDWLELGSPESWALNQQWIRARGLAAGDAPFFSFCLTGQQIDRGFYDALNSYTGETGSDGVVRVAAANLNAAAARVVQQMPTAAQLASGAPSALRLDAEGVVRAEPVPFALVPGVAHGGAKMGIMGSVRRRGGHPVLPLIRRCLEVDGPAAYEVLGREFGHHTVAVFERERVEVEDRLLLSDRVFLHDACAMLIVRVSDDHGRVPEDFRITFTGEGHDPNKLPPGFLLDRQRNRRHPGTVTFFLNHDAMRGCAAVHRADGARRRKVREAQPGIAGLGLRIEAFPDRGFAHYHPCHAKPSAELLAALVRPHATVLLDVVLRRVIRRGTFEITGDLAPRSFRDTAPGPALE